MAAMVVTIYSRIFVVKTQFLACKRLGVPTASQRERERVQVPSPKAFMAAAQCTVNSHKLTQKTFP